MPDSQPASQPASQPTNEGEARGGRRGEVERSRSRPNFIENANLDSAAVPRYDDLNFERKKMRLDV